MMPISTITQIPPPTQVSLVATSVQGTSIMRVPVTDVAPSLPDAAVSPDRHGAAGYAGSATPNSAIPQAAVPHLSVLIPASLSTSSASLGASAIFATQLLSQDAQAGAELFSVYEEMVAASQVKYKPSNAGLPQPEPLNLFARMLVEGKTQAVARDASQSALAKEAPPQSALQAMAPQIKVPVPKNRAAASLGEGALSALYFASRTYQGTASRNQIFLDDTPVEAIEG